MLAAVLARPVHTQRWAFKGDTCAVERQPRYHIVCHCIAFGREVTLAQSLLVS